MFDLIKSIIWILGVLVIAYFVMDYLGYEINQEYFAYTKENCEARLRECGANVIKNGIDNAQCDLNCTNPELIIKKK